MTNSELADAVLQGRVFVAGQYLGHERRKGVFQDGSGRAYDLTEHYLLTGARAKPLAIRAASNGNGPDMDALPVRLALCVVEITIERTNSGDMVRAKKIYALENKSSK